MRRRDTMIDRKRFITINPSLEQISTNDFVIKLQDKLKLYQENKIALVINLMKLVY
jgi:hypothetical protein